MDIENLVTMANQIGAFYESMPDRDKSMHDIADHIKRFWEPRMRRALLAYLDQQPGESGLTPLVHESIQANRDWLTPALA